jgi:hypothetical protein
MDWFGQSTEKRHSGRWHDGLNNLRKFCPLDTRKFQSVSNRDSCQDGKRGDSCPKILAELRILRTQSGNIRSSSEEPAQSYPPNCRFGKAVDNEALILGFVLSNSLR